VVAVVGGEFVWLAFVCVRESVCERERKCVCKK